MSRRTLVILLCLLVVPPAAPAASGVADVAALQVGLRRHGLYRGDVDGLLGPQTTAAVQKLQRRAGLAPDGVPGAATRAALGRFGRTPARVLGPGAFGWDVARLQFMLARHGFPSGTLDGRYGPRVEAAVRRFQEWAGLQLDGRAGPQVMASLRNPPRASPITLSSPVGAPATDGFGPRGARFHTGVDYPAPRGTPVGAAAGGVVRYAGPLVGGWGRVVTIAHGADVRTMYAHLSAVRVEVGERVETGETVGLVGATGYATGPHLHFEVRLHSAAVDPLTALR